MIKKEGCREAVCCLHTHVLGVVSQTMTRGEFVSFVLLLRPRRQERAGYGVGVGVAGRCPGAAQDTLGEHAGRGPTGTSTHGTKAGKYSPSGGLQLAGRREHGPPTGEKTD